MKINYNIDEPINVHFNISDYSSKVELAQMVKGLLESSNGNELNFVLKPPMKSDISIPDVIKALQNYKQSDAIVNITVANEDIIKKLKSFFPSEIKLREEYHLGKDQELLLEIKTGDITEEFCDAIVNGSSVLLKLGSGVSGAIRRKTGESLQEEMYEIAARKNIENGDAVITGSHGLKTCMSIIHAACVEGSETTVRTGIRNSLLLCNQKGIKSIAFPALATGIGGMSKSKFARIFIEEVNKFADNENESLERITLVLWSSSDFEEINEVVKNSI